MSEKATDTPPKETPKPGEKSSTFIERMAGGAQFLKKKPEEKKPEDKPKDEPPKDKKTDEPPKKPEDKPKEPAKEPAKDAPKDEPKGKNTDAPKEEPKKVEPLTPPPAAPIDAKEIAEAAARGVASELAKKNEPKKPSATDGMSEKEAKKYSVLQRMEKDYGTEYAGIADKFSKSLKAEKEYEAQWKAANPGKKFDREDEEHNEFYDANDIDWDDDHYAESLASITAEKLLEKQQSKDNRRIQELEAKERLRAEEPKIVATKRQHAKGFFNAMGADYKDVIGEGNTVNLAEVKRLQDDDPVKAIVFQAADSVEAFSELMYRLYNGLEEFSEKDGGHVFLSNFVNEQEVFMKSQPSDKQINSRGQRFATAAEYAAMSPAQQAFYWRLMPDDVMRMYAEGQANRVQAAIREEEIRIAKMAEKRGFKKVDGGNPPVTEPPKVDPPKTEEHPKPTPTPEPPKPVSPSGTVEPRIAPPNSGGGGGGKNATGSFISRWTGR